MISIFADTNERGKRFQGILLKRYLDASKFVDNKRVLDIGCGTGAGTNLIAEKGAKHVIGVDYSQKAINFANNNFRKSNLTFTKMDARNLRFPENSFDVILCFELIEHLPDNNHNQFVLNLKKILKNKGICICSTPNKKISSPDKPTPNNPYHFKEFMPVEFLKLFKKHFSEVEIVGYKNINKKFKSSEKKNKSRFLYKIIEFINKFKLTHEMSPLLPSKVKYFFTRENKLPSIKLQDFILTNDLDTSECLLVMAIK